MHIPRFHHLLLWLAIGYGLSGFAFAGDVDFERQIAPLFKTYCVGCHNETEREGELSLASLASLRAGNADGPVVVANQPEASKLFQVLADNAELKMPPKDEPQLKPEHKELIRQWITQGAKGDVRPMTKTVLKSPALAKDPNAANRVTAACASLKGQKAIGKFGRVELISNEGHVVWVFDQVSGKVNQLRLTPDGKSLIVAGGIAGVSGELLLLDVVTGKLQQRLVGHNDAVYCGTASADGKWIASGSYDRSVILWDRSNAQAVKTLTGHNGAIYDVDIDPASALIATASADQTVKIWSIRGERLDTLGQPQGEVLSVRFAPDGNHVLAAGVDRQIRKWKLVSRSEAAINPLLVARFAHEDDVLGIEFIDHRRLVSMSADRTVKLWDLQQLRPLGQLGIVEDLPTGLSVNHDHSMEVYALNGSRLQVTAKQLGKRLESSDSPVQPQVTEAASVQIQPASAMQPSIHQEAEPNDDVATASALTLPVQIKGCITESNGGRGDVDHFRFEAQAGQRWVLAVNSARSGAALDSRIEVLDAKGQPVLQTKLQALRESYFTFRGKDSSTSDDFRVHNWEDMELNEYLYSEGEIVKLWLYPRGPDSGFKVYPGFGARFTYFGTTPTAHALGAPAYIVRPLVAEEEPLPNGLPVFPIYAENDDDGLRRWGKDSRLVFQVPRTGEYIVKLRDARGFGGTDYSYTLDIIPPRPDFEVKASGTEMKMPIGSGREWQVTATRHDEFDGPIAIELQGLPQGFSATNPLVIEAGQLVASGTIYATALAKSNLPTNGKVEVSMIARGLEEGRKIEHTLKEKITIELVDTPELQFRLVDAKNDSLELEELTIQPGQTISARVVIERGDVKGPVSFGKEDSGRNLPHGTIVDNIGLNGLLIPDGMLEREFFVTASKWLPPQRRQIHLRTESKGNATSKPIWLNVVADN